MSTYFTSKYIGGELNPKHHTRKVVLSMHMMRRSFLKFSALYRSVVCTCQYCLQAFRTASGDRVKYCTQVYQTCCSDLLDIIPGGCGTRNRLMQMEKHKGDCVVEMPDQLNESPSRGNTCLTYSPPKKRKKYCLRKCFNDVK